MTVVVVINYKAFEFTTSENSSTLSIPEHWLYLPTDQDDILNAHHQLLSDIEILKLLSKKETEQRFLKMHFCQVHQLKPKLNLFENFVDVPI